jgi:hypothetical protein
MKKSAPVCPHCGKSFDPEAVLKTRRGRAPVEEKVKKPAPDAEVIDDLPVVDEEEADDTMIEDADELGEDDVDVEDVVTLESAHDDEAR